MQTPNIVNTVVDEVNQRTYVIVAPRVLTDGEIYKAIRQEILRRGGRPLAQGETITLTVTSKGGKISPVAEPEPQKPAADQTPSIPNEAEGLTATPASLG